VNRRNPTGHEARVSKRTDADRGIEPLAEQVHHPIGIGHIQFESRMETRQIRQDRRQVTHAECHWRRQAKAPTHGLPLLRDGVTGFLEFG
jgi:hypothetical protein